MKFLRKTKAKRRAGRGSVLLIAGLLISSAALRLATGLDIAVAGGSTAPRSEPSAPSEPAPAVPQPGDRAEMGRLLAALKERESRLETREAQLDARAKALSVAGEEIEERLLTLETAEARLRETLALADGAAEGDLARLTTVYEAMKPKDAAALFQTMEPDFAAGFLARMRPDAAAAIMAGLPPEIAYSVSAILAGRNASVPKS